MPDGESGRAPPGGGGTGLPVGLSGPRAAGAPAAGRGCVGRNRRMGVRRRSAVSARACARDDAPRLGRRWRRSGSRLSWLRLAGHLRDGSTLGSGDHRIGGGRLTFGRHRRRRAERRLAGRRRRCGGRRCGARCGRCGAASGAVGCGRRARRRARSGAWSVGAASATSVAAGVAVSSARRCGLCVGLVRRRDLRLRRLFVAAAFFAAVVFFAAVFFFAAAFFLAAFLTGFGSSGCSSRVRPSRSARRRSMSAYASCRDDEGALAATPAAPARSSTSLLVIPSSLASSWTRIFFAGTFRFNLSLSSFPHRCVDQLVCCSSCRSASRMASTSW